MRTETLDASEKKLSVRWSACPGGTDVWEPPIQHFTETVAIYVGEKGPECVVVEITKSWTLWKDGTVVEHGYHYSPHDFFGKLSYETKCIGSIPYDPGQSATPGSFVERHVLPNATWRRIK